ncbi:uncharacterized protein MONOS_6113 [Monocercomonoides exilis]|uniref:uncharacterized protein n=1 Tax=Monocercomonoides exilis TaxID=2049356 RepID=UPI003559C151|nr:hypothetical protein MONOS_6113 [Monocercomonoides exilis]|eukprot:MONOS_6113.1-p1 / transcript=MONOS_6113.1 / gene=MONOS_6113 / organism=Monocercomonoides_exilis_PA203 / gene_product=unspecified product / transcript_product=unspecified product / location=Mono_scaffold00188:55474-62337(+) / protein_length=2287 / sequence_SO=supercontig / SO=protein_coding / is_pseudo=false
MILFLELGVLAMLCRVCEETRGKRVQMKDFQEEEEEEERLMMQTSLFTNLIGDGKREEGKSENAHENHEMRDVMRSRISTRFDCCNSSLVIRSAELGSREGFEWIGRLNGSVLEVVGCEIAIGSGDERLFWCEDSRVVLEMTVKMREEKGIWRGGVVEGFGRGNEMKLKESRFECLRAEGGMVLARGSLKEIIVENCLFKNVSGRISGDRVDDKSDGADNGVRKNSAERIGVASTIFERVENGDSGMLYDGCHTQECYFVMNTSFERCEQNVNSTRQENSTGDVILEDSIFTVHTTGNYGGAVCIRGNATLSILRTTFRNCSLESISGETRGGAVYATGTGFINMVNSSVISCSVEENGSCYCAGIAMESKNQGNIHIVQSIFEENTGRHFSGILAKTISDILFIGFCIFLNNCANPRYGGCIGIWDTTSINQTISNCFFSKNTAHYYGGAIMFGGNKDIVKPVKLRFLLFENNTCTLGNGNDMAFRTDHETLYSANDFATCSSTSAEPRVWNCFTPNEWECPTYESRPNWISNAIRGEINVNPIKEDQIHCGTMEDECKTIGYGVTKWNPELKQKISLSRSTFAERGIGVEDRMIVIEVKGSGERPIIRWAAAGDALVWITCGSIEADSIVFVMDGGASGEGSLMSVREAGGRARLVRCCVRSEAAGVFCRRSMFVVENGVCEIEDSEIEGIQMEDCALLESRYPGELRIAGGSIRNIVRSRGNGAVMSKTLREGETVIVCNTTVKGCRCSSGNGGGVYVGVVEGSVAVFGGSSVSTKIEGCKAEEGSGSGSSGRGRGGGLYVEMRNAEDDVRMENVELVGNEAKSGKMMFICSADLKESCVKKFGFLRGGGWGWEDYAGIGDREWRSLVIPLKVYFEEVGETVHASRGGADHENCGFEYFTCRTLKYSLERQGGETHKVEVHELVEVSEQVEMTSGSYEVTGDEGLTVLSVVDNAARREGEGEGEGVFCVWKSTVLKRVKMWIPAILSGRGALIEVRGGSLSVLECAIDLKASGVVVRFSLVKVTCGSVVWPSLRLESVHFDRDGVLIAAGSEASIVLEDAELRNVSRVSGDGLIEGSDGSRVELQNVGMTGCNEKSGSMIVVKSGSRLEMNNSNVDECELRDGAVVQVVDGDAGNGDEGSVVEMENSTFLFVSGQGNRPSIIECKCDGGICVNVSGCVFESCKSSESEKGGVVYFSLNEGGWLRMSESTIKQGGCSAERGKGGGLYLHSEVTGELDFELRNMKFHENVAASGRDVFVECLSIENQINETQFRLDLRESVYVRQNGMCGMDRTQHTVKPIDLMDVITIFQSDTIVVSSIKEKGGKNEKLCGTPQVPCRSIDYGILHVSKDYISLIFVEEESVIERECDFVEMMVLSSGGGMAQIIVKGIEEQRREGVIATQRSVEVTGLGFVFAEGAEWGHARLIEVQSGMLRIQLCSFSTMQNGEEENGKARIGFSLIWIGGGGCAVSSVQVAGLRFLETVKGVIEASGSEQETSVNNVSVADISVEDGSIICSGAKLLQRIGLCSFANITRLSGGASCILLRAGEGKEMGEIVNCTFRRCTSLSARGSGVKVLCASSIAFDSCTFDGCGLFEKTNWEGAEEGICFWNGSVVEMENCSSRMKDTVIANSSCGGAGVDGGDVRIEMGMFENNNGTVEKYRSIRRNVVCSGLGKVNVVSLKGGDGAKENSSLWILSEGCTLEGIAGERGWALFVPVVEEAHMREAEEELEVRFVGRLLIPCNLSFGVSVWDGNAEAVERHEFVESDYVSEEEVCSRIGASAARGAAETAEVRVRIEFGDAARRQGTKWFVVKNRTEAQVNGNEKLVEGGNKEKSSWALIIAVTFVVLFLIVLLIAVAFIVRWRKQKRRTEELEEIVEDTVRKDPKLVEMMTMEMSPEEQWKRAERDAEKKSEERIKKRIYDTNMQHSESSEHLLSESGSTEYILGRDSDKIPEWALEKVEEEEIQKRTPSPSISSTSTADTSDTDSTFVRSESLCPTTSSMSNLVDGMACSSPHEKLIADLRDSLFMLLHGKNEKKEMAIGSLKEREMTAAQILFWVVNGALHSFNEMENPLQSLANLSPHIVLFSEQMVIVIALHSDCSDESDSDSSSIASSCTIATSSSDVSLMSERFVDLPPPSSAFEDDEGCRDEYKRWKAPELMGKKKMRATKESVVFSVGMMLWECLTLKIPFGDYSAEAAGQKIVNGERPKPEKAGSEEYGEMIKACLSASPSERWGLMTLKREFFSRFPAGAVFVTASDAIDFEAGSDDGGSEAATRQSRSWSGYSNR